MDGTLINSIEGIAYSMNNVLLRHGFPVHSPETYKSLVGNGVKELVRRAVPADVSEDETNRCLSGMREEYVKNYDYGMAVYDGIEDLLRCLQEQGINIAVDTNKDEDVSRRIIGRFLPDFTFSLIMGSRQEIPKKPDPARARRIAAQLGILPEQCVYLGDSEVDIMTAKNAGMIPVSAAWGYRKVEDLVSAHAEHIIKKPMELLNLLHI